MEIKEQVVIPPKEDKKEEAEVSKPLTALEFCMNCIEVAQRRGAFNLSESAEIHKCFEKIKEVKEDGK